ncbi:hypothetical protein E2C01_023809 [Portunus trituberculatus]|uniref:Uncharacterized protein n=1 Tax=Portunus trituberculatus TaxID=210409 RepID=A0A5B7E951_PORTR|nr:hypothetical protein [Portunus trituberculatus]
MSRKWYTNLKVEMCPSTEGTIFRGQRYQLRFYP